MWFYVENGQKAGPVTEQTLALLLSQGTINSSTLVWMEGMPEWKQLGGTELSESILHRSPMNEIESITPRINPKGLKTLFIWFFITSTAYMVLYPIITLLVPKSDFSNLLSCIYAPFSIAAGVLEYILLYKFWKIIQDGFAKTSPGKAVGYSFIPLFNFYWIFIAIGSLAGELNHYILRHFKNDPSGLRRAHPAFAWIFILFSFGSSCVSLFFLGQIFSTVLSPTNNATTSQGFMVRFLIILLVSLTLSMITFYDFYLTSKSIVNRESSQHLN
jgi:hypothetical protein